MKRILLLILCCLVFANYAIAEEPLAVKKEAIRYKLSNFHIVAPGIMRSAQPSHEAIEILQRDYGLKTILNLRSTEGEITKERKHAEKLGITFISIPMRGEQKQSIEKIERCLDIISNQDRQPVLVHCYAGKDRAGLVIAAYRIKYHCWSLDQALTEMFAYGYTQDYCFNLEKSLKEWLKAKE